MTQRDVDPQAQSLCLASHARQLQCSHQIHLRWFTSRTKRATIQMRICVRDTVPKVSATRRNRQWAGRPNLAARGSYGGKSIRSGAALGEPPHSEPVTLDP